MQCEAFVGADGCVGRGTCLYKIELSSHHLIIKQAHTPTPQPSLFIDTKLANRKLFQHQKISVSLFTVEACHSRPIRGQYPGHVITISQSEASMPRLVTQ